jgi:hypothetical protein
LASRLHDLYYLNGAIHSTAGTAGECTWTPIKLPYGDGAEAAFDGFEQEVLERIDREPNVEQFVARSAEMAIRLATIRAAGRLGDGAKVELDDMKSQHPAGMACGRPFRSLGCWRVSPRRSTAIAACRRRLRAP